MTTTQNAPANHDCIAAIDVGTNSIHLVVARLDAAGTISVLDTDKVTLKLGQSIDANNNISDDAIHRVVETMRHMKEISSAYPCRMRVVATHATRIAANHVRMLNSVKDATGIDVEVIDGIEEARLAFLGMRFGLNIASDTCLGVDIGGGSTELIIAKGEDVKFVRSLNLGAVVLTKKFFKGKDPSKSNVKKLSVHVHDTIASVVSEIRKFNFEKAVIASGTAKAFAIIHSQMKKAANFRDENGYVLTNSDVEKIVEKLIDLRDADKIKDFTKLDSSRCEILLAGGVIFKAVTDILNVKQWMVSSYGLREGLVVDTHTRFQGLARADHPDIRWENVKNFARKLQVDEAYSQHVTELALQIYDGMSVLSMAKASRDSILANRELLRACALLHEVGKFLSYTRYHRHSQYLIANSSIMGFTVNEKNLIGLIARYHRKGMADAEDSDLKTIPNKDISRLNFLAGCLRLAAALNRTRQSKIKGISVIHHGSGIEFVLKVQSDENAEVELQMARKVRSSLEKIFAAKITYRAEPAMA